MTEYGVHWNFFFTLALLPLIYTFIKFATGNIDNLFWIFGIGVFILTLAYQSLLTLTPLEHWIINDTLRDNIFSMNREGILGLIGALLFYFLGYSVIYCGAQQIGEVLSLPESENATDIDFLDFSFIFKDRKCRKFVKTLFLHNLIAIFSCMLTPGNVSRRLV